MWNNNISVIDSCLDCGICVSSYNERHQPPEILQFSPGPRLRQQELRLLSRTRKGCWQIWGPSKPVTQPKSTIMVIFKLKTIEIGENMKKPVHFQSLTRFNDKMSAPYLLVMVRCYLNDSQGMSTLAGIGRLIASFDEKGVRFLG